MGSLDSGTVKYDVAIVGAGHGGAQTAIALRQMGFTGTIGLFSEEPELPYERPPLSKEYLAGDKGFERLLIRPAAFWEERAITLHLGTRVTAINSSAHFFMAGDVTVGYGHLVWAAGGTPRRLSCGGANLKGVHAVRNRADVDRMIAELPAVSRVVVIGGGYIGLEAAAVLTKLGRQVVIVEALDRVLARVAGTAISRFIEAEHRAQGVEIRLGTRVDCLEGDATVTGVRLSDGPVLAADMVVVGIGIEPAVGPLSEAGAEVSNGVAVDAQGRTTLPGVFALGDCAEQASRYAAGARLRIESVQNATDQAKSVARAIIGIDSEPMPVPWFWSNQYDLKLQTVGLSIGHDLAILRGDPAMRSFSVIYLKDGRVVAIDAINAVRDYVQGKALVEAGCTASPGQLADPGIPLKELLLAR